VAKVLEAALAGTELHFSQYQSQVYIANGRSLMTELPPGFSSGVVSTGRPEGAFDYSEFERTEKLRRSAEEKVYVIGKKTQDLQGEAVVSGIVRDIKNGEAIVGASVFINNPRIGVATDVFGRYSLKLSRGRHDLNIQSIGMKTLVRHVMLYADGTLNVEMEEDITPLKEVIVESD